MIGDGDGDGDGDNKASLFDPEYFVDGGTR